MSGGAGGATLARPMDVPYALLSWPIAVAYLLAPAAGLAWAVRRKKAAGFALTAAAGVLLGVGLTLIYAVALRGPPGVWQALLAAWLATGLLVMLKAADAGVTRLLVGREPTRRRRVLGQIGRVVLLVGLGLPVVMAAVMVYRPKIVPADTPADFGLAFGTVTFPARDGSRVVGWWLPGREDEPVVLLTHGLGGGKADMLDSAARLARAGHPVLMIDLRAHGQSGGQTSTFGDSERLDVLGALDWLGRTQPGRRVVGMGPSMGAAALVAAAAEDDRLTALVLVGTYDDLGGMARDATAQVFTPPLDRLAAWIALPTASAHAGTDLAGFAPAELIGRVWPRPLLVLHANDDEMIPLARGQGLYDAASPPRRQRWLDAGGHNGVLGDDEAWREIFDFLKNAQPTPAV